MTHWTERSIDDFLYRILVDFLAQLEDKVKSESLTQEQVAQRMGVSKEDMNHIFEDPEDLTLETIIKYARCLGMKVSIVAYDDGDPNNKNGPINSEIFHKCWEKSGCPLTFFDIEE